MRIISYDGTKEEKERIEAEQAEEGYMLVEIQNIVEGNFLGFVDKDGYNPTPPPTPEATQLQQLQKQVVNQDARIGDVELGLAEIFAGGGD